MASYQYRGRGGNSWQRSGGYDNNRDDYDRSYSRRSNRVKFFFIYFLFPIESEFIYIQSMTIQILMEVAGVTVVEEEGDEAEDIEVIMVDEEEIEVVVVVDEAEVVVEEEEVVIIQDMVDIEEEEDMHNKIKLLFVSMMLPMRV